MKGETRKTLPSLLWAHWEKTHKKSRQKAILIDAPAGEFFTVEGINNEVFQRVLMLGNFKPGSRIAFCLPNGAPWIVFFLALQKQSLAAVPLDASLPEQACLDVAKSLRCEALYFQGELHQLGDGCLSKDICCIKVTSGTSAGMPKKVSCRAEHLIADGSNLIRTMGIRPGDRNLASIPFGHSYGLGNLIMPLILQGTAVISANKFVPRQLVEWISSCRVTIFPSVPAIFRALASLPGQARLSPLRLAISAGAPLTPEIAQIFHDRYRIKLHNFYGSSETGGITYDRTGEATLKGRSVGKPVLGVTVKAVKGKIRVQSAAVAKGKGTWVMPDRGELNGKGELVLLGRRGREINIGGKKVHPSEVEQAIRSIAGVSDVIVWEAADAQRAFVQAAVETSLPLKKIQNALAAKLPEWKLPKHYFVAAELPRSERGKIDLTALRRKLQAQLR